MTAGSAKYGSRNKKVPNLIWRGHEGSLKEVTADLSLEARCPVLSFQVSLLPQDTQAFSSCPVLLGLIPVYMTPFLPPLQGALFPQAT